MGYMGLDTYSDSDKAWDLSMVAINAMVDKLNEGLKEKGNSFNTKGPVNVALFFEAFIIPLEDEYSNNDQIVMLAKKTRDALKDIRNKSNELDWEDENNKKDHIEAYDRMLKSLNKFLLED